MVDPTFFACGELSIALFELDDRRNEPVRREQFLLQNQVRCLTIDKYAPLAG